MPEITKPVLRIKGIDKRFGGLKALTAVSFDVRESQIKGVIGPNGAGKTTLLNIISRLLEPDNGEMEFLEYKLLLHRSYEVARLGIGRVFQLIQFAGSMTVLEIVKLGSYSLMRGGMIGSLLSLPRGRREEKEASEKSLEIVKVMGLEPVANRPMNSLTFPDQKRVELGRALAGEPKLVLLDEPASGLNPFEAKELGSLLLEIKKRGISLLMVEHNVPMILEIADEIMVLNFGTKIAEGTPKEIVVNEDVVRAYLGDRYAQLR